MMSHVELVPRELDLSAYSHGTMVDKFNIVPGLKTSTAFFTFLRANLVVDPSVMATPTLEPTSPQLPPPLMTVDHHAAPRSSAPAPPPSSSAAAAAAAAPPVPDDLPPLSVGVLDDDASKTEALRLVADSIAQQRQSASLHAVSHPYLLAAMAAALAASYHYSWRVRRDLGMALMLCSGVVMTFLLTIRYFTGQYIQIAESLRWSWLHPEGNSSNLNPGKNGNGNATAEEDTVIGVRFGRELIGALVLRLEPSASAASSAASGSRRHHRRQNSLLRGGRGVVRAWTVALRYRGRGVGGDMLREAVRVTRERCGKDAAVGFAREHANSSMVLPEVFNGGFRRGEQRAAKALEQVLVECDGGNKRRRKN